MISKTLMRLLAAAALFATAPSSSRRAGAQDVLVVSPESRVFIDGSSNLSSFTCAADYVSGGGRLNDASGTASAPKARIDIQVSSFDCKNGRMNKDLMEALKAEEHPLISYRLDGVRLVEVDKNNGAAHLDADGTIWVAGVARRVRTRVVGDRLANGLLRASGELFLSMSEFNIDPPTALFGLVRARDTITVRFDLVATPHANLSNNDSGAAVLQTILQNGLVQ